MNQAKRNLITKYLQEEHKIIDEKLINFIIKSFELNKRNELYKYLNYSSIIKINQIVSEQELKEVKDCLNSMKLFKHENLLSEKDETPNKEEIKNNQDELVTSCQKDVNNNQ